MDLLRTVNLSPGGRPIVRVNLADPTGLTTYTERDTFNLVPPAKTQNFVRRVGKAAGSVQSGESTDNFTALATWWVKSSATSDPNRVLANAEQLLAEIDDAAGLSPNRPKMLEWRPDGAGNSTFLELRGTGIYTPHYAWAAFSGVPMLKLDMSWPVAPLSHGLPLDIGDPFDVDSRGDYIVDQGGILAYSSAAGYAGGSLTLSGSLPAVLQLRHIARHYSYCDVQVTAQLVAGPGSHAAGLGVICHAIDASNYLLARIVPGSIEVCKVVAGVLTVLATEATSITVFAGQNPYWVRVRQESNMVFAEAFTVPPGPMGATGVPAAAATHKLSGADLVQFGATTAGLAGVRVDAPVPGTAVQYFEAHPYTYHGVRTPDILTLRDVPGSGPPSFHCQITTAGTTAPTITAASAAAGPIAGSFSAAATYGLVVTAVTLFGETPPSNEVFVPVASTSELITLTVTAPLPEAVTGLNVYRTDPGGAAGTEQLITALTNVRVPLPASEFTITDAGTPTVAGVTPPGAYSVRPVQFGLLSWTRRARNHNRVWNGDFSSNVDGWSVAATSFLDPATDIVRIAGPTGFYAVVDFPGALTYEGARFTCYQRFRAGVSYTFSVEVDGGTLTDHFNLAVGSQNKRTGLYSDQGNQQVALTSAWQTVTGVWVPDENHDNADFLCQHVEAAAGQFFIRNAQLYETAQGAPVQPSQGSGRGAMPPFGLLDAAACVPADIVGGTLFTNHIGATSSGRLESPSGSYFISDTTSPGPGRSVIDWWIDPGLYATPDDFAQGTLSIEVFWVGGANVQDPRVIISAIPDPDFSYGAERFSQEYGTVGRPLATSADPGLRWSRAGTLVLPVDPDTPVRWKLKCTTLWAGYGYGSCLLAELVLSHAARRASNPTGKSRVDGTYPAWASEAYPSVQQTKTILQGLRAINANATPNVVVPGQYGMLRTLRGDDVGLTGSPLELQPPPPTNPLLTEDHQLLVALSPQVPDDPSGEVNGTDIVETQATVHVAVTPRYRLARFG